MNIYRELELSKSKLSRLQCYYCDSSKILADFLRSYIYTLYRMICTFLERSVLFQKDPYFHYALLNSCDMQLKALSLKFSILNQHAEESVTILKSLHSLTRLLLLTSTMNPDTCVSIDSNETASSTTNPHAHIMPMTENPRGYPSFNMNFISNYTNRQIYYYYTTEAISAADQKCF